MGVQLSQPRMEVPEWSHQPAAAAASPSRSSWTAEHSSVLCTMPVLVGGREECPVEWRLAPWFFPLCLVLYSSLSPRLLGLVRLDSGSQ